MKTLFLIQITILSWFPEFVQSTQILQTVKMGFNYLSYLKTLHRSLAKTMFMQKGIFISLNKAKRFDKLDDTFLYLPCFIFLQKHINYKIRLIIQLGY